MNISYRLSNGHTEFFFNQPFLRKLQSPMDLKFKIPFNYNLLLKTEKIQIIKKLRVLLHLIFNFVPVGFFVSIPIDLDNFTSTIYIANYPKDSVIFRGDSIQLDEIYETFRIMGNNLINY